MERERRIGREGEIGSDIRRRDSGEIESATNSKPSKTYRSAIFMMVSCKSYDSEERTSKYRRTTTNAASPFLYSEADSDNGSFGTYDECFADFNDKVAKVKDVWMTHSEFSERGLEKIYI